MLELAQKALETALLAAQQPFPDGGASGARRWELQPSPASFLAELPRGCLGKWHEDKQAERGFGAGWLSEVPSGPAFLQSWHTVFGVAAAPAGPPEAECPNTSDVPNPNFRHHCIALGFSALGSSLVDHKLVTLCCDAS